MSGHGGGGGCPIYWLTWADMITLILTFFVVLASLGRIEQTDKYTAMAESFRETFGYFTPGSHVDLGANGMNSMSLVQKVQQEMAKRAKTTGKAASKRPKRESQLGNTSYVRNIRDGLMITVGGVAAFDEGSAVLLPGAKEDLQQVAKIIQGYRNKVVIRGHTSVRPLPQNSPFKDHLELSYVRARAAMQFLIENQISADRLTVEACGPNEPVKTFAYDEEGVAQNRRVEVIVKDSVVEDYKGDSETAPGPKT